MSEKADNYLESLFQGVDILIDKKLENVSYDTTIICTVIDNTNKKNGEYMVKNDSVTYKAYSDVNSYSVGDQVRVSVPMGDFSQKKFIVGKYVDDDSTSLTYTSPTDTVVNISENLALDSNNVTISGGIVANGEDNVRVLWNKTLDQEFLSLQNDNIYNRVILKANFRTTLDNYDLISGNYGLRIDFLTRPSEDSAVKIRRVLELDSDEMFGNVYHFSVKSPQSKVFIMENFGIIETVAISLYQKDNFINEDGEYIQSYENLDNIFVSDIVFGFGCDLTLLQDNAVQIYSDDNLYYKYANHTSDTNEKSIKLLWLNKNENNEYTGFSDGIYDPKYDEIAYLDLARTESRLLAQKGKENVPQDKTSLNLAANIIEAKPAIEKAINIVNRDLITLLREFSSNVSGEYKSKIDNLISGVLTNHTKIIKDSLESTDDKGNKKGLIPQYELVLKYGYQIWTDVKEEDRLKWGEGEKYEHLWPSDKNNYNKVIFNNFIEIEELLNNLFKELFNENDEEEKKDKEILTKLFEDGYRSVYDTYKIRVEKLKNTMLGYLGLIDDEELAKKYNKTFPKSVLKPATEESEEIEDFQDLLSYKEKTKEDYVIYGGKDLSAYNNKYCIYWYRYEKDYEPPDTEQFLPFGWKRINFSKEENKDIYEVIDANGKSSKDEVAEEEAKANVSNVGLSDKYIKDGEEVKNAEGKPVHSPKCSPGRGYFKKYMKNDTVQEKFMAVVFYNHVMYKSDELVFLNSENVPDVTTLEQGDILIFEHKDNSLDNYQIYGITNYLMDASAEFKLRQIRCHYDGILAKDEAFINGQLYWYVPNVLTMLSVDVGELKNKGFNLDETRTEYQYSSIELDAKNYEQNKYYILIDGKYNLCTDENFDSAKKYYERDDVSTYCFYKQVQVKKKTGEEIKDAIYEKDKWDFTNGTNIDNRDFWYKIKPYYSNDAINNEIKCVFEKSENPSSIQGTQFFTFGVRGTSGTKYTLEVTRKETSPASSNSEEGLKLRVRLLDANNEPVDIPQDGNRTLKVEWEWSNKKSENSQPITITNRTNEIDVNMPPGQYGIAKFILTDEVTIKNAENDKEETKKLVELETLFAVPFSDIITHTSGNYKDIFYLKGPTQIIYNSFGSLDNNSKVDNNYKLYLKKNVAFEGQSFESGSNVDNLIEIKYGIVIYKKDYTEPTTDPVAGFMPKIIDGALVASPMYISDVNYYAVVKAYYKQDKVERILWQQPLIIIQNRYASPVLNEWDGNFQIDDKNGTILSTMVGAGRKDSENRFSGVLMGDVGVGAQMSAGNKSGLGLYGFHEGAQSFGFNVDGTAFIGKSGMGRIEFDGKSGIIKSAKDKGMEINLELGKITSENFELNAYTGSGDNGRGLYINSNPDDGKSYFRIRQDSNNDFRFYKINDEKAALSVKAQNFFLNAYNDGGVIIDSSPKSSNTNGANTDYFRVGDNKNNDFRYYRTGGNTTALEIKTTNLVLDAYESNDDARKDENGKQKTGKGGIYIDSNPGVNHSYFRIGNNDNNDFRYYRDGEKTTALEIKTTNLVLDAYDSGKGLYINSNPGNDSSYFRIRKDNDNDFRFYKDSKGNIALSIKTSQLDLKAGTVGSNNSVWISTENFKIGNEEIYRMSIGSNFKVTNTGKIYASGVDLSGTIKASGGNIGGITIGNGTGIGGSGWSLTSSGGTIGGWTIGNNTISTEGTGTIRIGQTTLSVGENGSAKFSDNLDIANQLICSKGYFSELWIAGKTLKEYIEQNQSSSGIPVGLTQTFRVALSSGGEQILKFTNGILTSTTV